MPSKAFKIYKTADAAITLISTPWVVRKLRSSAARASIDDLVNIAFTYALPHQKLLRKLAERLGKNINTPCGYPAHLTLIGPWQIREEITALLKIIHELKPRRVLEIGTARGGTLFLFSHVAAPDAVLISVDLGGYPVLRMPFYKSFGKPTQKIYLLREDSHSFTTLEKVKKILAGDPLDFLFIDGDHTYEGVKRDFEMYSPLVRKGGVIAFHDIVTNDIPNIDVPKFWKEIKEKYRHTEIVKNQKCCGIGVILTRFLTFFNT